MDYTIGTLIDEVGWLFAVGMLLAIVLVYYIITQLTPRYKKKS
ncbi:MAG: hypothetical protein V1834_04250 [Candidatus Micrarchaeota archaeon]